VREIATRYGATGSGKTHTIMGGPSASAAPTERGLAVRAIDEIMSHPSVSAGSAGGVEVQVEPTRALPALGDRTRVSRTQCNAPGRDARKATRRNRTDQPYKQQCAFRTTLCNSGACTRTRPRPVGTFGRGACTACFGVAYGS
jgi:hypothetical protein